MIGVAFLRAILVGVLSFASSDDVVVRAMPGVSESTRAQVAEHAAPLLAVEDGVVARGQGLGLVEAQRAGHGTKLKHWQLSPVHRAGHLVCHQVR